MTLNAIAQEIHTLSIEERKQLITLLVDSLTENVVSAKRSLLELEGLGRKFGQGLMHKAMWMNCVRNEITQLDVIHRVTTGSRPRRR